MDKFKRTTRKLYYDDAYLCKCPARITKIGSDYIELDATVAYPEGGGQESDHGFIVSIDGIGVRFIHARKVYTTKINIHDFPDIRVDGVIEHVVHEEDRELLGQFHAGMEVVVQIDVRRRACLSLSHTASHLIYMAISKVRPDAVARTLGCHIGTGTARFDFAVEDRVSPEQLAEIERLANALVRRNSTIRVYPHPEHADARYWECEGEVIPCGGTHIDSTALVGRLIVRRKSMGKGKERIACEFSDAVLKTEAYHS
ncbi:alanyl-tRNA editing protein [Dyella jejuensis]|uniref:Alanyl-tRNA editing protein n=1 Tax=Dyella jejuensis TaxID=1432009 RepID=A0ABW8JIC2_9GAMM